MLSKEIKASGAVRLLFTLLTVLDMIGSALAHGGSTGAISGTVRDENGAAVTGAQIAIVNSVTGATERNTTSDSGGNFNATQLPPGTYRLVVTATGFSKAELPDIKVRVTETTTVNVPLKVGEIGATVTVTGAGSEVQLTSATTGQTLTQDTIRRLPLSATIVLPSARRWKACTSTRPLFAGVGFASYFQTTSFFGVISVTVAAAVWSRRLPFGSR